MSNRLPNENLMKLAEKEEPRFLGILLKHKDCLSDAVSCGIKPSQDGEMGHFLYPRNDVFYSLIFKNFMKYGTVLTRSAVDSIMEQQENMTDEDKSAVISYWDKIWSRHDITIEDYSLLKDHINSRYILGQFYKKWRNGEEIIKSDSDHTENIKSFINDINSIENIDADTYSKTVSIEEGINNAMEYVEFKRENPHDNDAIKTGLKTIDERFNGFSRGSYNVVSGMINGGKTTFLMNIGLNNAKKGYNVAYVSLEKDANLFFRRILSNYSSVDYNRMKRGGKDEHGLSDFWYERLKAASKDLIENIKPHYYCLQYAPQTTLTKIISDLEKLRSKVRIDVLIVDYLQVIGFESHHSSRPDIDLAQVHQRLMAYGKVNKMLTYTALQLKSSASKEIRKKASKASSDDEMMSLEINTEDYSGSQMVIADADNAFGVILNKDKPPTKMIISSSKARDDESRSSMILDFDGKLCKVSDPILGEGEISNLKQVMINREIRSESYEDEDDDIFNQTEDEIRSKENDLTDGSIDDSLDFEKKIEENNSQSDSDENADNENAKNNDEIFGEKTNQEDYGYVEKEVDEDEDLDFLDL